MGQMQGWAQGLVGAQAEVQFYSCIGVRVIIRVGVRIRVPVKVGVNYKVRGTVPAPGLAP